MESGPDSPHYNSLGANGTVLYELSTQSELQVDQRPEQFEALAL